MRRLVLGAALLLAAAAPSRADDRQVCNATSGPAALDACDRAIASGRYAGIDLARLHTNRGVERRRAGDLDGALADYSEAIRLNPTDPFAWNNRANIRRDRGDLPGAIADLTEALRVDSGYTAGYVNRGRVHEMMGAWALARADYEEAIRRPAKHRNGPGGQEMARQRLAAIAGR